MTTLQQILKLKGIRTSVQTADEAKRAVFTLAKKAGRLSLLQATVLLFLPVIVYSVFNLIQLLFAYNGQCYLVLGHTYPCGYFSYIENNVSAMFMGRFTYALLYYGFFVIMPLILLLGVPLFFKELPGILKKIERRRRE